MGFYTNSALVLYLTTGCICSRFLEMGSWQTVTQGQPVFIFNQSFKNWDITEYGWYVHKVTYT